MISSLNILPNFKIFVMFLRRKKGPDFIVFACSSYVSNHFNQINDANEPKTLTLRIWKLCRKNEISYFVISANNLMHLNCKTRHLNDI